MAIDNLNDFGLDQDIVDCGYPQVLADLFRNPVPYSGPADAALPAMEELQVADIGVIAERLNKRLGGTDLAEVFPGFTRSVNAGLLLP